MNMVFKYNFLKNKIFISIILVLSILIITFFSHLWAADLRIHKAAYNGDIKLVQQLLKEKPNINERDSSGGTALHAAMFSHNIEVVKALVNYGYDINAVGLYNRYTPLHDAVWANNSEAVKFILEKKANTNLKGINGLSAYQKAVNEKKLEIIKIFKEFDIKQ